MKTSIRSLALAAVVSAAAVAAQAQTTETPGRHARVGSALESVRISFADLNLDDAAGLRALDSRIGAAVNRVCGEPARTLKLAAERQACRQSALHGTRQQVAVARAARSARGGGLILVSNSRYAR